MMDRKQMIVTLNTHPIVMFSEVLFKNKNKWVCSEPKGGNNKKPLDDNHIFSLKPLFECGGVNVYSERCSNECIKIVTETSEYYNIPMYVDKGFIFTSKFKLDLDMAIENFLDVEII